MPPLDPAPSPTPIENPTHESHQTAQKPVGPMVGTIIILVLFVFGALYFWGQYRISRAEPEQLPLIPGDNSQTL